MERGMEIENQSISPSIDQLMCSSENVILPEMERKTEGQKKEEEETQRQL